MRLIGHLVDVGNNMNHDETVFIALRNCSQSVFHTQKKTMTVLPISLCPSMKILYICTTMHHLLPIAKVNDYN